MNSLKIKLQKYSNVTGKLNDVEQVQMEYWEKDIEKVNEFNSLYEEVEEFTSMCRQSLVNVRSPSYLNKKPSNIVYEAQADYMFSFSSEHGDVLLVWVKFMVNMESSPPKKMREDNFTGPYRTLNFPLRLEGLAKWGV